jgi:hypothetical protein
VVGERCCRAVCGWLLASGVRAGERAGVAASGVRDSRQSGGRFARVGGAAGAVYTTFLIVSREIVRPVVGIHGKAGAVGPKTFWAWGWAFPCCPAQSAGTTRVQ